jgi:RNA polymerase sigma-70 factor, ECF subfamily
MQAGALKREPVSEPARPTFEAVYEAEFTYVWRAVRRLGVRTADLEDRVHDVFVVVHRRLADFDPARPLRPWLFGIAVRVAAAGRRKDGPHADDPPEQVDESPGALERVAARQSQELLLGALGRLPLDQRAVVILHDIDGQRAPEIAAGLEIPLNTVYSRLRLGREKLAAEVLKLRTRGDL